MEAEETTQRAEAAMSKWTVAISYTGAATNRGSKKNIIITMQSKRCL